MKKICKGKKQLNIREFFKEFMKFFPIREIFTNFLLQEKLFAEEAKNTLKKKRTSRRSHKIGFANKSEALIEFRKDVEHVEEAKDFQSLDFAQKIDSRWI